MALGDKLPVVMGTEKAAPGGVATLDAAGKLAAAQRPSLAEIQGGISPNLLINWDFRNPVNRNGKTEYEGKGILIDLWESNTMYFQGELIKNQGIKLDINSSSQYKNTWLIYQRTDGITNMKGRNYTFSAFVEDPGENVQIIARFGDGGETNAYISDVRKDVITAGLVEISFAIPESAQSVHIGFITKQTATSIRPIVVTAAKLELGAQQTLARQNGDGEWELIDPPNYDLQYALCSQYSPITGEFIGSQQSNENLLDNSRWDKKENIINQRMQEIYTSSEASSHVFCIDRWKLAKGLSPLEILDNSIKVTAVLTDGYTFIFQQPETPLYGLQVTLSALVKGNRNGWIGVVNTTNINKTFPVSEDKFTLMSHTFIFPPKDTSFWHKNIGIGIPRPITIGDWIEIQAIKLELGPVQTLAHKEGDTWVLNDPPPDRALELAKCQRYQLPLQDQPGNHGGVIGYGFNADAEHVRICIPTPVTMRTTPSIIYLEGDKTSAPPLAYDSTGGHAVTLEPYVRGNYNNQVYFGFKAPNKDLQPNQPCIFRLNGRGILMLDANL